MVGFSCKFKILKLEILILGSQRKLQLLALSETKVKMRAALNVCVSIFGLLEMSRVWSSRKELNCRLMNCGPVIFNPLMLSVCSRPENADYS